MLRYTGLAALAALCASVSLPAQADEVARECLRDAMRAGAIHDVLADHPVPVRDREFRTLYRAALVLGRNGRESACEAVVEAMRANIDDRTERLEDRGVDVDALREEARKERIHRNTPPVGAVGRPVPANAVIGASLRTLAGENMGEIEDVLLDPASGRPALVLINHGDVLGIGGSQIAVPWRFIRTNAARSAFFIAVREDALDDAPDYDFDADGASPDAGWLAENEAFYEKAVVRE
ncbi:MAG: PRC-barrel domain-containing protein [Alphaproteobacteria bacterium]|nr:PRC-barrel domain-containing protein [Alphaproteobacteria bacterium]